MAKIDSKLNKGFFYTLAAITLCITPWITYDPINSPKFSLLIALAATLILFGFKKTTFIKLFGNRIYIVINVLFIASLIFVFISNGNNRTQQLFGVDGRNTGLLTYISLTIIALYASSLQIDLAVKNFYKTLRFLVLILNFYGIAQILDLDPVNWTSRYPGITGTFGNPNFFSAFLGFSSASLAVYTLKLRKRKEIAHTILLVIFSLFNLIFTDSTQGYLVFIISILASLTLMIFNSNKNFKLKIMFNFALLISLVTGLLDVFQKSPWRPILYQDSITYRGDFWRAGIKMLQDHPVSGVGIDNYRDWYLRSIDQVAIQRFQPGNFTDSAHNLFIDMGSNGGFPLIVIYSLFVLYTFFSAIRTFKNQEKMNYEFLGIFALWIGFQAQSLISINNIALAIWGWVTSGLVVAYGRSSRSALSTVPSGLVFSGSKAFHRFMSKLVPFFIFAGGIGIAIPQLLSDVNFNSALKAQSSKRLFDSVNSWPQSTNRMLYAVQIFIENNKYEEALQITKKSIQSNPNSYESWFLLSRNSLASQKDINEAAFMMKKLNPLASNP